MNRKIANVAAVQARATELLNGSLDGRTPTREEIRSAIREADGELNGQMWTDVVVGIVWPRPEPLFRVETAAAILALRDPAGERHAARPGARQGTANAHRCAEERGEDHAGQADGEGRP